MVQYKSIFPPSSSLTWRDDDSHDVTELIRVKGITGDTEVARKMKALTLTGRDTKQAIYGDATLAKQDLRILSQDVTLLADDQAIVAIRWGINDSPVLDDVWLFETYGEQLRVTTGIDALKNPIKNKYVNAALRGTLSEAAFLAIQGNKRVYDRGATVNRFKNIVHVLGRRQISKEKAALMHPHPLTWPAKYANAVSKPTGTALEGQWMCKGVRVYSRNRGWSLFVEAEFCWNEDGWEEFLFFVDQLGLIPGDIVIPAGMKIPWPLAADRVCTTAPYGVARPQTLKDPLDFGAYPFMVDLKDFNP